MENQIWIKLHSNKSHILFDWKWNWNPITLMVCDSQRNIWLMPLFQLFTSTQITQFFCCCLSTHFIQQTKTNFFFYVVPREKKRWAIETTPSSNGYESIKCSLSDRKMPFIYTNLGFLWLLQNTFDVFFFNKHFIVRGQQRALMTTNPLRK